MEPRDCFHYITSAILGASSDVIASLARNLMTTTFIYLFTVFLMSLFATTIRHSAPFLTKNIAKVLSWLTPCTDKY